MKKIIPFFCSFLLFICVQAQDIALNIQKLGGWDNDTLPTHFYGTFNDIWGYAANGREYAFMGSAAYIHVFDVTDPTKPVLIDQIAGGEETIWRDMKTYGDRLYAVSDGTDEGIIVIDLSDLPNSVSKSFQSAEFFGKAHNIFIDEQHGRLYTTNEPMQVLDLTQNPDTPSLITNLVLPAGSRVHDLFVKDNTAYLSSGNLGLFIYDFTDLNAPKLMASLVTNGYNHSSWISEDGTFLINAEEVGYGLPLLTIDLTQISNGDLEIIKQFKFPLLAPEFTEPTPHNPFIKGNYAYVSYYEDGLQIFDLSDPADPKQVAYYDTYPENTDYHNGTGYKGCWGVYPFLPSGNILASDMEHGLFVLEADLSPVSSNEIEMGIEHFAVYPNPVQDLLNIELTGTKAVHLQLQLTDIAGRMVLERSVDLNRKTKQELDIAKLPKGIYILSIQGNNGMVSRKVVKQ